jgi:hypothetical protein
VWDLDRGIALVAQFTVDASLHSCSASTDGRFIVAGDGEGHIHYLSMRGSISK